jgi:multidrug efflux pump subunit AcrA (membrane-fusion protein)
MPGMYAEVDLALQRSNSVMAVPVTAVDAGSPAAGTVMVNAQNRLEKRAVAMGMETADLIEIRSGISDSEMVMIGNRGSLRAGQEVRPKLTRMTAGK